MPAHLDLNINCIITRQMPARQFGTHAFTSLSQYLMIGDVGLLDPTDGHLEFFFNITLPKEHPYHLISVPVPPSFQPFALNLSEDTEHVILPNNPIVGGNLTCTTDESYHIILPTFFWNADPSRHYYHPRLTSVGAPTT